MGLPLVSVVIPTIPSRAAVLERALACVARQTYPNIEVVLVPGPPTIGQARNVGCERAQGDIIAFFDDDDVSRSDRVAKQVDVLEHSDAMVCGTSTYWVYEARVRKARLLQNSNVWCASMAFWRTAWQEYGFAPCSRGEMIGFRYHHRPRTTDMKDPLLAVYYRWQGNTT